MSDICESLIFMKKKIQITTIITRLTHRFLICLCLLSSWNMASAQMIDLLGESKHRNVEFEEWENFILVNVRVKDNVELKFIVDTGSEHVILFEKLIADLLGLKYTIRLPIIGSDLLYSRYALVAPQVPLYIEGLKPFKVNILVIEETTPQFNALISKNIVGIIGASVLSQYNIEINYRTDNLTFYHPDEPLPLKSEYKAIPIVIHDGVPYSHATIFNSSMDSARLKLLIDSGAGLSLILHDNTDSRIIIPDNTIQGVIGNSINGRIMGYLGRLYKLKWEQFIFPGILVSYQTMDSISLMINKKTSKRNGIIGNVLLRRFHVFLSYSDSTIYLKPNKDYNKAFKYDRSGISFIATGPNLNDYYVSYIVRGSPADSAGVQVGDRILSVNYWPMIFYTNHTLNEVFKGPVSKVIRLRLKRGDEKLTVRFRLRKLI